MGRVVKYRRYIIISICFVLLPLIGVFFVFKKAPTAVKVDCEKFLEVDRDTEALFLGSAVEQTFTPEKDGLCHVEVAFETGDRSIPAQVFLEIRDDSGAILVSRSVPVSEIEDYKYLGVDFTPVASSKNRLFKICISSDVGEEKYAVAVCASVEDKYHGGALYRNGAETDTDIAFRTFFDNKYEAEHLKSFVCLLIVLAALIAALYPNLFRRLRKPIVKLSFWTACASALAFCILAVYNRVSGYCSVIDLFSAKALLKFFLLLSPVMMAVSPAFYNMGRLLDRAYAKRRLGEMLRELAPAFTIFFVFLFMLLLYEPLLIYSTNKTDFQFSLKMILPSLFSVFLLGIAVSFPAAAALYLVNKLFAGTPRVYRCTVIGLFVVFFAAYVQGNWMVKDLPVLMGGTIEWSAYLKNDIVSVALWIVLIVAAICLTVKFTAKRVMKIAAWISAAIFAMLFVGLIGQMAAHDAFQGEDGLFVSTTANFDNISKKENLIIIMVDAVDAVMFDDLLSANDKYKEVFEDFTFYTDAMAVYPCTLLATPSILTGKATRNEILFLDFFNESYNNCELFKALTERDYDINLYSPGEILWNGERAFKIANATSSHFKINSKEYIRQQMKYVAFKYLPYAYKQYSGIETVSFDEAFTCDIELYSEDNIKIWRRVKENNVLTEQDNPVFQYVQLEGAHEPFNLDKDMNVIKNGTYGQKGESVITLLDAYLQRLKDNGVYDNTAIVILADHGHSRYTEDTKEEIFWLTRFNPVLLIKGRDEKHELQKSDVPVSYLTDLQGAYLELLDGRKTDQLFADVSRQRTRTALRYQCGDIYRIVEYETDGKAWEWEKFRATGNIYE